MSAPIDMLPCLIYLMNGLIGNVWLRTKGDFESRLSFWDKMPRDENSKREAFPGFSCLVLLPTLCSLLS